MHSMAAQTGSASHWIRFMTDEPQGRDEVRVPPRGTPPLSVAPASHACKHAYVGCRLSPCLSVPTLSMNAWDIFHKEVQIRKMMTFRS